MHGELNADITLVASANSTDRPPLSQVEKGAPRRVPLIIRSNNVVISVVASLSSLMKDCRRQGRLIDLPPLWRLYRDAARFCFGPLVQRQGEHTVFK